MNPRKSRKCIYCGKDPAAGYAMVYDGTEKWYCHGDEDETPTCYERAQFGLANRVEGLLNEYPRTQP